MLERVSAQPRHLVKDFKLLTDIVASYRLQITDYRLQITDYRLQITNYRLQIMLERVSAQPRYLVKDFKLLSDIVASYRLEITDYGLQITNYRLCWKGSALSRDIWSRTSSCSLTSWHLTGCKLQITKYRLPRIYVTRENH